MLEKIYHQKINFFLNNNLVKLHRKNNVKNTIKKNRKKEKTIL